MPMPVALKGHGGSDDTCIECGLAGNNVSNQTNSSRVINLINKHYFSTSISNEPIAGNNRSYHGKVGGGGG